MKLQAKAKKWLIGLGAGCLSLSMCATGCVLGLRDKANAITNDDTTSYVKIGEIWDGSEFNKENLNKLLQYVSGNANASAKDLSSVTGTTKTSAQMKANAVGDKAADKDIVVTFGGLDWEVVYLSPDKSSNPTLTLWLSNNKQTAFRGRSRDGAYYGYYEGALYSDWSGDWYASSTSVAYPSAMYGTSYIRAVTLNNGGMYTYGNGSTTSPSTLIASKNPYSAFAKFTMSDVADSVTQFLNTPRQIGWQENGQSKSQMAMTYNSANENWSNSISDDGFYRSGYNYAHKTGNDAWADDYLWLPSLTETGYSDTKIGMWNTSVAQRQNYDGTTAQRAHSVGDNNVNNNTWIKNHTILRTADESYAYNATQLTVEGTSYGSSHVTCSGAVRPALHLNLKKAADTITYTWHDFADTSWQGDGLTEATAYRIDTPAKLAGIAKQVKAGETFSGKYFKQTANINLSGYVWEPIGDSTNYFSGTFDGDGYNITNIVLQEKPSSQYQGLFGYTGGSIKNVNIKESYLKTSSTYLGSVVGYSNYGTVSGCRSSAKLTNAASGTTYTGGIVGYQGSGGTIEKSIFSGNCSSISQSGYAAGILAYSHPGGYINIRNCDVVDADISGAISGGLVGGVYYYTVISCCTVSATIEGSSYVGGAVGDFPYTFGIENVSINAYLYYTGNSNTVGGIVGSGYNGMNIKNSLFIGGSNVKDVKLCGGEDVPNYTNCYSVINQTKTYIGTDFSDWAIINGINDGLPVQRALYFVASVAPEADIVAYLQELGFVSI